jgi:rubrerythrin
MKFEEKNGKIVLKDFNAAEALRLALYVEEEGARFYRELADRAGDESIVNELEFLWKEEQSHRDRFLELLAKSGSGRADVPKGEDVELLTDRGIFGPIKKLRMEDILCDNAEALRLGATVKKRMISFFHSLRNNTKDNEAQKVIDEIIKQEEQHLQKLKLLLAY